MDEMTRHLDVLRVTPATLAGLVREHGPVVLRTRPFDGKWTPNEILGHLVDHEIVTACRIRTTRLNDVAWLDSYPQERWVETQHHDERDPETHVQRFASLRALNLEQYDALSPEALTARHARAGGGDLSLAELVERHADHDRHHLEQIQRYLEASRSRGPA